MLKNHSESRCRDDVLEINEHFLKWHHANLSEAPHSSGFSLFSAPSPCPLAAYLHPAHPAPPMLMPPQNKPPEILSKAEFNHNNAHAESQQPSYVNHMRSPPTITLPEQQYYPRNILPLPQEPFRQYMLFPQPSSPEPMSAIFDNANYNVIDGRELPPEQRPDSNFVLMNSEQQRKVEPTWPPVNKAFFEGVSNVMQPFASNAKEMFGPGDRQAVLGADRLADWSSAYSHAEEMFGPGDRQAVLGANRLADRSSAFSRADEELEEKLEALARRFDTEFNSSD